MAEIKIQIPEGYEGIDEEKSNLSEGKIVFKKKEVTPWRKTHPRITGFYVNTYSEIREQDNPISSWGNENIFATKKQAESMLAMAQLSQIIQNDPRFGGPITDEEWNNQNLSKYCIERDGDEITIDTWWRRYQFLAFHTKEQRDLFLKENEDLIKRYLMFD